VKTHPGGLLVIFFLVSFSRRFYDNALLERTTLFMKVQHASKARQPTMHRPRTAIAMHPFSPHAHSFARDASPASRNPRRSPVFAQSVSRIALSVSRIVHSGPNIPRSTPNIPHSISRKAHSDPNNDPSASRNALSDPNKRHPIPRNLHSDLNNRHPASNNAYPTSNNRHPTPNNTHSAPNNAPSPRRNHQQISILRIFDALFHPFPNKRLPGLLI
jgi:integrin beta 8